MLSSNHPKKLKPEFGVATTTTWEPLANVPPPVAVPPSAGDAMAEIVTPLPDIAVVKAKTVDHGKNDAEFRALICQ